MKLILIINLFFCLVVYSQKKKQHIVKLEIKDSIEKLHFSVDSIIDNRIVKDNIGFAQKGAFNRRVEAIFPDDFSKYLKEKTTRLIAKDSVNRTLSMIINQLVVSEQTKFSSESGICRLQIEFVENIASANPISYGTYNSEIITKGLDVTKNHGKRILSAITECVTSLEEDKWYISEGHPYKENKTFKYDYTKTPKKGVYPTFFDLSKSEPVSKDYIFDEKGSKKYRKYFLKDSNNKRIRKRNMAISDGENIYIHASFYSYDSHYVKSKFIGKYIYFEDRIVDQGAALAFGLVGALASNVGNGIILDTATGLVHVLTNKKMKELLEVHTDILNTYNKSSKLLKNKKEAILSLNSKFN